jgi:hypothetical protein
MPYYDIYVDRYGWMGGFVQVDNVIRGGLRRLNNWSVVRG